MFAFNLLPDPENLGKTLVHQGCVNLRSWHGLLCVLCGLWCLLRLVVDGRVVEHNGKLAGRIMQWLCNKHGALSQPQRWRGAVRVVRGMVLVHKGNGKGLAEHLVLVLGLEDGKLVGISIGEGKTVGVGVGLVGIGIPVGTRIVNLPPLSGWAVCRDRTRRRSGAFERSV